MIDYRYSYLALGLLFLAVWLFCFIYRKDVRKQMLFFSLLFGIGGFVVEPVYILDWWKPLTITATAVGFEDFIFGFVIGGIATVLYEELFRKKVLLRKKPSLTDIRKDINLSILIISWLSAFFCCFFLLNLNTFYSSIIGFLIPISIIYFKRRDLILGSIISGLLLMVLSFIVYSALELITPGWVNAFWYFKNIPHWIFLGVPFDDLIWYFLLGALIGPLYEYWQEGRIINKR